MDCQFIVLPRILPDGISVVTAPTATFDESTRTTTEHVKLRLDGYIEALWNTDGEYFEDDYGEISYEVDFILTVTAKRGVLSWHYDAFYRPVDGRRHPHTDGSYICLGDLIPIFRRFSDEAVPAHCYLEMIRELLKNYNPGTAYFNVQDDEEDDE